MYYDCSAAIWPYMFSRHGFRSVRESSLQAHDLRTEVQDLLTVTEC